MKDTLTPSSIAALLRVPLPRVLDALQKLHGFEPGTEPAAYPRSVVAAVERCLRQEAAKRFVSGGGVSSDRGFGHQRPLPVQGLIERMSRRAIVKRKREQDWNAQSERRALSKQRRVIRLVRGPLRNTTTDGW